MLPVIGRIFDGFSYPQVDQQNPLVRDFQSAVVEQRIARAVFAVDHGHGQADAAATDIGYATVQGLQAAIRLLQMNLANERPGDRRC